MSSSGRPQCPDNVHMNRMSREINDLKWSRRREAREGPPTAKDVSLSKWAADQLWILSRILSSAFFSWGAKGPVVLSQRARWACALWLNLQDPEADQHSQWLTVVFPLLFLTRFPFTILLMVPRGGEESLLVTYSSGGERRIRRIKNDAEHRDTGLDVKIVQCYIAHSFTTFPETDNWNPFYLRLSTSSSVFSSQLWHPHWGLWTSYMSGHICYIVQEQGARWELKVAILLITSQSYVMFIQNHLAMQTHPVQLVLEKKHENLFGNKSHINFTPARAAAQVNESSVRCVCVHGCV